jgi:hypothetical protein
VFWNRRCQRPTGAGPYLRSSKEGWVENGEGEKQEEVGRRRRRRGAGGGEQRDNRPSNP